MRAMSQPAPSVPATAAPSPKRSRRIDVQARPLRWTKNGRSREGQLYRAVRAELIAHCGGAPSIAERTIINRLAMMQLHLAHLDESMFRDGGLSPHATREYLAWCNSVAKLLRQLGLKGAAERPPTTAEALAALYGAPADGAGP